jgi:PIN domain nuclease of toxin-antitoxin system
MKLLLDTHVFIWWSGDLSQLSATALAACHDPANTLLLSIASVWEMQIKLQLGKMTLRLPLADLIAEQQANRIQLLDVKLEHVLGLEGLPTPHKDPFDRILAAQSLVEGATLLSADAIFSQYPVSVMW